MMTKIRIVERIYKVDGEVKFGVSGEKKFPTAFLEKFLFYVFILRQNIFKI